MSLGQLIYWSGRKILCLQCWGYCTCEALALTVIEDYLSIACHLSEDRLLGLCSVMRLAYLEAS